MARKDEFIAMYSPAAQRVAQQLNVPVEGVINHWGLETGWGKSVIPGTNNLGNIKDFSGGGVAATDNMTGSRDKYRRYETPDAFADDYAKLLTNPRYARALNTETAFDFANGLQQGGYAEDPNFARKVAGMGPTSVLPMTRSAYGGVTPIELIGGREGNLKVQDPNQISPDAVAATDNINRMQQFKRQMLPLALGSMMSEDKGSQLFGANTFREAMEGVEPFKMQNGVLTDEGQYITDQDQSGLLKMTIDQMRRDQTADRALNQQTIQGEDRLADDYRKNTKVYESVLNDYKKLKAATPDAIGDISMVYNYMKILDPTSTVREGEAATVEQARGVPSTVLNLYNKLFEGVRLTPEQRSQILNTGLGYAESAANSLRGEHDYLRDVSKRRGYNFDNIVPYSHSKGVEMVDADIAARKKPAAAQPTGQVGTTGTSQEGRRGVQSGVPTGVPAGALPHPEGGYYTVVDGQIQRFQ